jgi:flagellar protein FliO/FliZ
LQNVFTMYAPRTSRGFQLIGKAAARATRVAWLAAALLLSAPCLAFADGSTPFAAPAPVASFAAPSEGMPLVRVILALLLVLGAVFAAAKLSRRMGMAGGVTTARLEVLAQAQLGPRERAVLLRVGGREVLLGVATGNVRLLLDLHGSVIAQTAAAPETAAGPVVPADGPVRPTFRDMLMRSLGR